MKKDSEKKIIWRVKFKKVTKFKVGNYVLLQYPNKPLGDKLSGLYRGPIEIISIDRPDIFKVRNLMTDEVSSVYTSRLRPFRHPTEMTKEVIKVLSAIDLDEYYVDKIMAHEEKGWNPKNWKFKVKWIGYETEDDSWLNWPAVKDLATLDSYSKEHPELKLDCSRSVDREVIEIFAEESTWRQLAKCWRFPDTLKTKVLVIKLCQKLSQE